MALYETIFIARQDMSAEDVDNLSAKLEKVVKDGGGKADSKEYWGLRKLAYKINKAERGHYVLLNIDADQKTIAELNRVMSINEDIVRNMTFIKTSDFDNKTELFASKNAKDFKPAAAKTKKEEAEGKFDAIIQKFKFDN